MYRTAVVLAAVLATGCSFAMVDGPPSASAVANYRALGYQPPGCTTSKVVPAIDGVSALVFAIAGVAMLAEAGGAEYHAGAGGGSFVAGTGLVTIAIGGVQAASAINGSNKVDACREYLERVLRPKPDTTRSMGTPVRTPNSDTSLLVTSGSHR